MRRIAPINEGVRKMSNRAAKGTGSVRKRSNGSWEASYTLGTDPGTGKQIRRSITGKTQKEVTTRLRQILSSIDNHTYTAPTKITVGQWLDEWLENGTLNIKPGTRACYIVNVAQHIKPLIGNVMLTDLKPNDVQGMIKKLSQKGLSPKSVKNINGCLHQAMKYAVECQRLVFNPAAGRKLPKIVKQDIEPLDKPDVTKFLAVLEGHEQRVLFETALFTGMRSGELLGLTWDCVDFTNGTINVCKQLRPPRLKGESYTLDTTKNSKPRTIKPAPAIMTLLKEHRRKQFALRMQLGENWNDGGFPNLVFTHPTGEHLSQPTLWKMLQKLLEEAGLAHHRFHDLRHTFAVLSLQAGDDPKTVQGNLGHYTAAFTLEVYAHVTDSMKTESADRMDELIHTL